jgi:nicotinate-nucleotide adenylyltransferase
LKHLSEKHPDKEFKVIVGEDNLDKFSHWKNYEQILENYGLYVYPRPHAQPSELKAHPRVRVVDAPLIDISATFIRNNIRKGQSIRYLVPDAVNERIQAKKFYL